MYSCFDNFLAGISFANIFFALAFIIFNRSRFCLFTCFLAQSFFAFFTLLYWFLPSWLPHCLYCFYIYFCRFTYWLNSMAKVCSILYFSFFSVAFRCSSPLAMLYCTVLELFLSRPYACLYQYSRSWCWYWDL